MPRKTPTSSSRQRTRTCFNEAAARCRGKLVPGAARRAAAGQHASMRPRPDAAENEIVQSAATPATPLQ